MSLKPILGCDGKPALHPDGQPVLMESPCPWVPWTWAVRAGYAATILSTNPGLTLTIQLSSVGSSSRSYLDTRVCWNCGKTGLKVSAAFTGGVEVARAKVPPVIAYTTFIPGDGGGPTILSGAEYYYYRFPITVAVDWSGEASVTLIFSWY